MRKKIITAALLILLCLGLSVPVFATDMDRLVDDANLLSVAQQAQIEAHLDALSQEHQLDIVVVTVDDIRGYTSQQFADDYFDYNGYGQGYDRDGILLLISMEERDWAISTSGWCITAFTDAGLAHMEDEIVPYLSDGEYDQAFSTFADLCEEFVIQARNGSPYDSHNLPKGDFDFGFSIMLALVIGIFVALIVTGVMRGQLKSVRSQPGASSYLKAGSMNVTKTQDIFLYRNVSRRAKPKNTSSGGSSSHRSSSGRSHGGRSGKF